MSNPNRREGEETSFPAPLGDADYQHFGEVVAGIAFNRGVPLNDVDDIVQDTLMHVAKRGEIPADPDGNRNPDGFVGTIAWRRISDSKRRARSRPMIQDTTGPEWAESPFDDIPTEEPSVEDMALTDPALLDVLRGLPERQRTALFLEAEGYSREQIAAHLDTNIGALKGVFNRARASVIAGLHGQLAAGGELSPTVAERLQDPPARQQG